MLFKTIASVFLLGIYGVSGQLTNTTILGILNATGLSPSYKFVQLISSSPSYQPILDILSRPGNITFFVPSDEVFDQIIQQFASNQNQTQGNPPNSSNNNTIPGSDNGNGTQQQPPPPANNNNNGTSSGSVTQGFINKIKNFLPSFGSNVDNTTTIPSSDNNDNNSSTDQSGFPLANATYNGTILLDYIFYHILPGKVQLMNQTENILVRSTFLTNLTLDKFGYGVPVIINSNATQSNSSSSSTDDNNNGNQTMISSSWVSNLIDSDTSTSNTPVYWVGNGLYFANVTIPDIEASNGILHVINNVLIPPGNLTSVYSNVTNSSQLDNIISQNATIGQTINNYTNITIFVSNDNNLNNLTIDQLESIYANQSVSGIYYTTNFTDQVSNNGDGNNNSSITLNTFAGGNITVSVNNNTITLNNHLTIVKSNILFDGGVIHLVNGDFGSPSNTTEPSSNNPGNQPSSSSINQPSSLSSVNQPSSSSSVNQPSSSSSVSQQPTSPPQEIPNDNGSHQVGDDGNSQAGGGASQTPDDENSPFQLIPGTDNLDNNNDGDNQSKHNPLDNEPLPFIDY